MGVKFASFWRRLHGVIGSVTERVFESEVNFVIGQAQGLIRKPLFVPIRSQLGNVAGGLQRSFIHQRSLPRMRILRLG